MKSIIFVALVVVAVAAAAPPASPEKEIAIIRSEYETQPEGGYNFSYETENGITRQETGETKEVLDEENKPHKVVVVRGTYSYKFLDNAPETVSYYADETGFHAEGESIPKAARR